MMPWPVRDAVAHLALMRRMHRMCSQLVTCPNQAEPGRKICAYHREMYTRNRRDRRAAVHEKGEVER